MTFDWRKVLLAATLALFVPALLEATLGVLARLSPRVETLLALPEAGPTVPPTIPDERLGHRPNPAYPQHDRNGFRNPQVPARAHMVVLGDSQTYGSGVAAEQAWPRQLEAMIGETVYSMAYGGWGPAHSLLLWDEALALSPAIVVEAFYAGNDLFDAFDLVYNKGQLPELRSPDPDVQERVRSAEALEPIASRVSRMFHMGATLPAEKGARPRAGLSPRRLLSRRSSVYGLLRRTRHEAQRLLLARGVDPEGAWREARAFAEANPTYCQVFSDGALRTVFTSEYRLSALDLKDARIGEGLRISLEAMRRMQEAATARGIRFLVVLLPTKEAVFGPVWRDPPASYRTLSENEERLWSMTRHYLEDHGIAHVDGLPALRQQLAAAAQPYPVSYDGHPNEHGHQAIARLVAAHLEGP
jgi:hypothetical protein